MDQGQLRVAMTWIILGMLDLITLTTEPQASLHGHCIHGLSPASQPLTGGCGCACVYVGVDV